MDIGIDGVLAGALDFGFGAVLVFVGSGVAQASLEPQASALEKPGSAFEVAEEGVTVGLVLLWDGGAGADRLNADFISDDGTGTDETAGSAGAGAFWEVRVGSMGSAKSNRSFEAVADAGLVGAAALVDAKLKSPKSFAASEDGFACDF